MRKLLAVTVLALLAGCESAYYDTMEQFGVHKRDILVDRIEDAQEAQEEGQEQFKDALEQFQAVVNFDGGELEDIYNRLNDEYEASEDAADEIRDRIDPWNPWLSICLLNGKRNWISTATPIFGATVNVN